jgi:hypothetical protein
MLYRSVVHGGKAGGLLYPPVFLGCLEVLRTPYLNGPRIILLFVGAFLLLTSMDRRIAPGVVRFHEPGMDGVMP